MDEFQEVTLNPLTLARALEAGVVVHGTDTSILYANPKALELLHLEWDQALGKVALDPCWKFIDTDRQPLPIERYPVNRVMISNAAVQEQLVGIVDGGGSRTAWVNVSAYPEYDDVGRMTRVVVTFIDVTDQIRVANLREAQLEIATKSSELTEEPLLQLLLRWCEKITGSTVSFFHFVNDDQETIELITWSERTLHEYCHVEELNRHYPISEAGIWAEAARTKNPVVVNSYAQVPNKRGLPEGHASLARFISMPLLEGDMVRVLLGVGNKAYAYTDDDVQDLKILTDQIWRIVKQKRTEASARRLAQAVEQTPATIVMTNRDGLIDYVNPAFTEVTGYQPADVCGKTPRILKSGENEEKIYEELWSTISAGRTWSDTLINKTKNGNFYSATTVISPIRNQKREIIGYLGVGEDVTKQVKLENQLRQAQKMEAIGRLTGGIAHDFNNLLGINLGNLELLQEQLAGDKQNSELLADAIWAAKHGAELTHRLLAFSRRQSLNPKIIKLNMVLHSMTELLRRTLAATIEIREVLASDIWNAWVDQGELERVLVNLAVNARDAMPNGGVLTLETRNIVIDKDYAKQFEEVQPGEYALLSVTDTGVGMSPEIVKRVFEPFFTTKGIGKGSGLGLSMVYGFVKQSKGHVTICSELGHGTTVQLYLPRTKAKESGPSARTD